MSPSPMMGPIHWGGPHASLSRVHGCSTAMTPQPDGRDAQVSGPSMHAADTSMACGHRRMVGSNSSITDNALAVAQALQTMTVNGRSVQCGAVNAQGLGGSCLGLRCPVRGRAARPFRGRS